MVVDVYRMKKRKKKGQEEVENPMLRFEGKYCHVPLTIKRVRVSSVNFMLKWWLGVSGEVDTAMVEPCNRRD